MRDALLASSETLFGSSQPESREALETTAKAHLHEMETIAQQVVQEQGYSYPVKAELVTMPFTERIYEDLTMPAGTYEAIRITIGAAAGKNWWCVMYPPLCIPVAEDVAVQNEQAKAYFSDAEQDVLYHPERYRVKWKLAEWFKKWTTSEQTDHTTSHWNTILSVNANIAPVPPGVPHGYRNPHIWRGQADKVVPKFCNCWIVNAMQTDHATSHISDLRTFF